MGSPPQRRMRNFRPTQPTFAGFVIEEDTAGDHQACLTHLRCIKYRSFSERNMGCSRVARPPSGGVPRTTMSSTTAGPKQSTRTTPSENKASQPLHAVLPTPIPAATTYGFSPRTWPTFLSIAPILQRPDRMPHRDRPLRPPSRWSFQLSLHVAKQTSLPTWSNEARLYRAHCLLGTCPRLREPIPSKESPLPPRAVGDFIPRPTLVVPIYIGA